MQRHLFIIIFAFVVMGNLSVSAQGPSPTPTPLPGIDSLPAVPVIAPDYRSDERRLPDLGRLGVDMANQRSIMLREAIEIALDNNRDIEVTRKNVAIAEFDVRAARAFFQPRLTGQTFYEDSTVPNISVFTSNEKTIQGSLVGNLAVQGYAPKYGTLFQGSFNNQRLTTNNPISVLSPQLNAGLGFAVTQPLFRGRKFDQPRRVIEIAKRNFDLSNTQFRQRSIEVVAGVQRAYWDLTFALRNLQVQRDGVRDAQAQLQHNRRLVQEGQLAPIDIVAAETQVANFELAVYEALNIVSQAENALKSLMSPNRQDPIWEQALTPVEPVEAVVPNQTISEAMGAAIDNRPELEINQAQKDINAIDQKLFRDQTKPQIDLIGSYNSTGIGGQENPNFSPNFVTPCVADPASPACQAQQANLARLTGSPYRGIFSNRYPVFRVGVNINLPLFGDKTAKAQLGRSLVEAERLETQREQIEQGIQVEVRNALQAIRTAEARLRSSAIARENSALQYESEQRKLNEGQSDIYKVLERQIGLAVARSNELRARTELNKAIAGLQRATGTTLTENNVEAKLK